MPSIANQDACRCLSTLRRGKKGGPNLEEYIHLIPEAINEPLTRGRREKEPSTELCVPSTANYHPAWLPSLIRSERQGEEAAVWLRDC
ncbi:hypothetical protein NDU88_002521 [Pleurodeles waltl]|uniref:Uncharacterized protein n=1 Tax=Pleurodeles waltl TaxID=8319 RepID=A0AAV7Q6X0_PLEWA|nr:hypothetical protein NDU88_002521 [Pleurodeles waltl]